MKRALVCLALIFAVSQLCFAEGVKIQLDNGKLTIFDNELPDTIKKYYNTSGLARYLNNPPMGFVKEYPFNSKIILGWDSHGNTLVIVLEIDSKDLTPYLILRKSELGVYYLDASQAYMYLHNLFFWLDQTCLEQRDMPFELSSLLMSNDIQGYLFFNTAKHQLVIPIRMSYEKNGAYYDPYSYMQYPIVIDGKEINPYVNPKSESYYYKNWNLLKRYPLGFAADPITGKKNEILSNLIGYFGLGVEKEN